MPFLRVSNFFFSFLFREEQGVFAKMTPLHGVFAKNHSPYSLSINIVSRTNLTPPRVQFRSLVARTRLVRTATAQIPLSARSPPVFPRPHGHRPFFLIRTAIACFPSSSARSSPVFPPHPYSHCLVSLTYIPAEPSGFSVTSGAVAVQTQHLAS